MSEKKWRQYGELVLSNSTVLIARYEGSGKNKRLAIFNADGQWMYVDSQRMAFMFVPCSLNALRPAMIEIMKRVKASRLEMMKDKNYGVWESLTNEFGIEENEE